MVEDLSVRRMIRNHHLARSIAGADGSEFRRVLEYKTSWYGSQRVIAPRFYPSTKTRSPYGHVEAGMPLGERVFRCEGCGAEIDPDLNAVRNPASLVAGSSWETETACEAEGSGRENCPVKQESPSEPPAAFAVGNTMP